GEGVVRRPPPPPAPPGPGGGRVHRRGCPRHLGGRHHPAQAHRRTVMRWLLGCGILFALASVLFVVPASAEGPALITVSAGHGLSVSRTRRRSLRRTRRGSGRTARHNGETPAAT